MNSDQPPASNPFAAPTADISVQPETGLSPEETIRNQYLRHEHNIKSIGSLFLLSSIVSGFITVSSVITAIIAGVRGDVLSVVVGIGIFAAIFTAQVSAGIGLHRLSPKSRIPAAILATLMLIGIPVGTILGVVFLYLLFSKEKQVRVQRRISQIVAATPHIKLKTSKLLVIVLLVLVAFLLVAIGGAMFSGF